jgi:hypothetical protein
MTTHEGNMLIAQFMGYKQNKNHPVYPNTTYWFKDDKPPLTILLYDTSWNDLMPVIQEICNEKIGHITIDECTEDEWLLYTWMNNSKINSSISAMHNKVVYFIQWYNENKL